MKFGVREICDVVLKAKANQKIGNKQFFKGEPVIYFDTLKTSSMEGQATTVYAQGGRGNARLMAWEGERTVTFTMEDALISPAGFMILSGAGLIDASVSAPIYVHVSEQTDAVYVGTDTKTTAGTFIITEQAVADSTASGENKGARIYVMATKNGEIISEPFIAVKKTDYTAPAQDKKANDDILATASGAGKLIEIKNLTISTGPDGNAYTPDATKIGTGKDIDDGSVVVVDYYTKKTSEGTQQIEITPDKFGGNYYLEASTLFRDTNGVDMPAEFIIPNCKIQSNFTFTMASSGDPSTFTFTMDAFPDYTRFDKTKKVLAAIQIISEGTGDTETYRTATAQSTAS